MKTIRLLFMGASRLVGLLERFASAASALDVALDMYSLEDDSPWHAISVSGLATVIAAAPFRSPGFAGWLLDFVARNAIDIVIPNIDSATVALSETAACLIEAGALPVVSSTEVCRAMADKAAADSVFRTLKLCVPGNDRFPVLAKPRFGASSRGISLLMNKKDLDSWKTHNRAEDYVVQTQIQGREFSLDAYVDSTGRTLGIVSRQRIVVSGGEAMVTRTEHLPQAIEMVQRLLCWNRWFGPLTVQVIDDGERVWLLECNPRFGSGVTCSIEAGLNAPEWILRERLGLPLPDAQIQWRDGLCLTRSRRDHFLWLS